MYKPYKKDRPSQTSKTDGGRRLFPLTLFELLFFILMLILTLLLFHEPGNKKVSDYSIGGGMTYTGALKNFRFDGEGVLKVKDKGTYKGGFADGRFVGKGTFLSDEGWSYKADFVRGRENKDAVLDLGKDGKWELQDGKWRRMKEDAASVAEDGAQAEQNGGKSE